MFKVKKKDLGINVNITKAKDICIIGACFVFISCMVYLANIGSNMSQNVTEDVTVNKNIYTEKQLKEEQQITLSFNCINLKSGKVEEIGYKVPLKEYMLSPELIFAKEYIKLNIEDNIVSPFAENLEVEGVKLEHGKLTIDVKSTGKINNKIAKISKEKRMDAIYKTFMNIKNVEEVIFRVDGKIKSDFLK